MPNLFPSSKKDIAIALYKEQTDSVKHMKGRHEQDTHPQPRVQNLLVWHNGNGRVIVNKHI